MPPVPLPQPSMSVNVQEHITLWNQTTIKIVSYTPGVPFDLGTGVLTPEIFKTPQFDPKDFS